MEAQYWARRAWPSARGGLYGCSNLQGEWRLNTGQGEPGPVLEEGFMDAQTYKVSGGSILDKESLAECWRKALWMLKLTS